MKKSRFVLQLLAVISVILLIALYFQRHLMAVADYVAFAIILLLTLVPCIFIYGMKTALGFFQTAFDENPDPDKREKAISYFTGMAIYIVLASIMAAMAVVCFMFLNMQDLATISPFIGASMLTPIYGIMMAVGIFLPLKFSLEQKR